MSFYEVAVLIPAYEMAREISLTLGCLRTQTYKNFQVVIVDDSESDGVAREIWRAEIELNLAIKYIRRAHKGSFRVASAWNILWPSADVGGDGILLLTTSHCLMREDWIANHLAYHRDRDNLCVLGPHRQGSWSAPSTSSMWDSAVPNGTRGQRIPWTMFRCYSDSIRKKHIAAIGGWDEAYDGEWGKEDTDIAYRLYQHGIQFVRGDTVDVVHLNHPQRQVENQGVRNSDIFFHKFPELRGKI